MRYATVFAAAAFATLMMAAAPGTSALADRDDRARSYKSYDDDRRANTRKAHKQRQWRRTHYYKRGRHYYAYPWGPWGPFAAPPGL